MSLSAFPETAPQQALVTVSSSLAGMLSERTVDALYRRLQRRHEEITECLILATCARLELVALGAHRGDVVEALTRALRDSLPTTVAPPTELTVREGQRGADWLFRIAAGLESPILGEHEILGQLRDALADGLARAAVGPVLRRLVEGALAAGGRARQETGIARGSLSLARISALALEPTPGRRGPVLIVGAGRLGRQVALQLRALGYRDLRIASRTRARAEELARDVEGSPLALEEVRQTLPKVDALVTAVSGEAPILQASLIAECASRGGALHTVIDLGSPPNITTDAPFPAELRWIGLHDLVARADEARTARAEAIPEVERMIVRELSHWTSWLERRSRRAVPLMMLGGSR